MNSSAPLPPRADGSPLRIAHVVHRFLPELGGTETHTAEVTRRLAERDDVDVTVVTTDRSGELPPLDTVNGVRVLRKKAWPKERDYYASPGIYREIASGDYDLVHMQGVHTLVPVATMVAARRSRKPYVLTFHSGGHSSVSRSAVRSPQFKAMTPLLRGADHLIAVSRFERNRFSALTDIPHHRFTVIGNGGSLPAPVEDVPAVPGRIVSSGRLERYKGHHRAIEALPLIRRDIPDAHLVILGGGPYEQDLRDLSSRLGVESVVTIKHLPPADRGAMARELASATVMAALSSYEAHPVGVMEAVAGGLPVLGSDIAGIGDLVEDGLVTGLDPEASTERTADALVTMLRTVSGAPRTRPDVELPTWESCTDAVVEVYRGVLAARAPAGRP
ncbi:glycosyltransferase [Nakamurella sp. YIM 132087]|uniref:Glycosyltransferase n=1 Tax=Nakamurella alba TaxID=2665158 RepID=A0A7K1FI01_9ACTN|nr:glycosyltransferase family 4 protein [Nakamurella alba]MTD13752.1 glycosyltransferase [Nakamurella alba]